MYRFKALRLSKFFSIVYKYQWLVRVRLILDKSRINMTGYWKFNRLLFDEKDFPDQILLTLMRELKFAVVGNKSWAHLKSDIR